MYVVTKTVDSFKPADRQQRIIVVKGVIIPKQYELRSMIPATGI